MKPCFFSHALKSSSSRILPCAHASAFNIRHSSTTLPHETLKNHIFSNSLFYPSTQQKLHLTQEYAISRQELENYLVLWRRERRDWDISQRRNDSYNSGADGSGMSQAAHSKQQRIEFLRQWLKQNQDNSSSTPLTRIKNLRHLQRLTGLSSQQLRKSLNYIRQTQKSASPTDRRIVMDIVTKYEASNHQNDSKVEQQDGVKSITEFLPEEAFLEIIEATGLTRLQIRSIIRAHFDSKHPATRKKVAQVKNMWKEFCNQENSLFESHPSHLSERATENRLSARYQPSVPPRHVFDQFISSVQMHVSLSRRQIRRIVLRSIHREAHKERLEKLNRLLLDKARLCTHTSDDSVQLSQTDIEQLAEQSSLSPSDVHKQLRLKTYFPLTKGKKDLLLNEFRSFNGSLSRDQKRLISRKYTVSMKQINYLLRSSTMKYHESGVTTHSEDIQQIRQWFEEHGQDPATLSSREFKDFLSGMNITSKQAADTIHRLKNSPRRVTQEAKDLIREHVLRSKQMGTASQRNIEYLVQESQLSRKQVLHFIREYSDPSGSITQEKRDYIAQKLAAGTFDVQDCQEKTELSRRQVLYLRRKILRQSNEGKKS